jgi:hypothetical protein
MNAEKMSAREQDIETVREPEKRFGPTGTLKISIDSKEEASGVYERGSLPEINYPPLAHSVYHEPKVIINDQAKLVELRGGIVEVKPAQKAKFDVAEIEAELQGVDREIAQAQKLISSSTEEAERGLAFKRLAELKRDKDRLVAQLPFAKIDELEAVEKDLETKADRYHILLQRNGKTSVESDELTKLTKELQVLQAHRNQLKQSIDFRKNKNLSTTTQKTSFINRLGNLFKRIAG